MAFVYWISQTLMLTELILFIVRYQYATNYGTEMCMCKHRQSSYSQCFFNDNTFGSRICYEGASRMSEWID